jgi:hypothetical protein
MNTRLHPALSGLMPVILAGVVALTLPALASAAANCPNEAFRTGPSASLPDCRAYEMVSPPDKNGGSVDGGTTIETAAAPTAASADGEAVTYSSDTSFTEAKPLSSLTNSQYMSRRGPDGWSTEAIIPVQEYPIGRVDANSNNVDESPFQGFSEDLSHGFIVANEPSPVSGAPVGYYNPYLFDTANDGFTLLSTVKPPVQPPGIADEVHENPEDDGLIALFAGFSADSSHIVFQANDALTENAVPGKENLYEWTAGHLELVSLLPDGIASAEDPTFGSKVIEYSGNDHHYHFQHTISADGKRVFWSTYGYDPQNEPEKIYMREAGVRTVEVSASQRTDCADHAPCTGAPEPDPAGPQSAKYETSSADGSLVYFTSCEKLTNDSTASLVNSKEDECYSGREYPIVAYVGQDLYQYNVNTGHLADLTVSHSEVLGGEGLTPYVHGAEVLGVLGASEDGSYVYYAARGVLANGASVPKTGPSELPGSANVYLWHDGETRFIATLRGDYVEHDFAEALDERTSRVTSNGLHLAFQSRHSLTGYDNAPLHRQECPESREDGDEPGCIEVYEYDATTNSLECASCDSAGLPPTGNATTPVAQHVEGGPLGWETAVTQQRYLLDNGRLFFESTDALLPQASNGQQNVYEHEPDGVGGCQRPAGCLYLISTGASQSPSYFVDASTSGNNVFIETQDQLVPEDRDQAQDIYDVRIDGGFPSYSPPPCSGEACKPPVTPAPPIYQAPPSATFFGAGNPSALTAKPTVAKAKRKVKAKKKPKVRGRHVKKGGHAKKRGKTSNSAEHSTKGMK